MDRLATFEARYRVGWIDLSRGGRGVAGRPSARPSRAARRSSGATTAATRPAGCTRSARSARAAASSARVDVAEPPPDLRAHVRRTIRATLVTTLALAATMMLMTLLVGAWVVGGPIAGLINQARRVAAGDLGRALGPAPARTSSAS